MIPVTAGERRGLGPGALRVLPGLKVIRAPPVNLSVEEQVIAVFCLGDTLDFVNLHKVS